MLGYKFLYCSFRPYIYTTNSDNYKYVKAGRMIEIRYAALEINTFRILMTCTWKTSDILMQYTTCLRSILATRFLKVRMMSHVGIFFGFSAYEHDHTQCLILYSIAIL